MPDEDYIYSVDTGLGEDTSLLHVPEDRRPLVGRRVAAYIDTQVRQESPDKQGAWRKKLCGGCFMAVVVNALIKLAKDNGYSIAYIRDHMNKALDDLAARESFPKARTSPMSAPTPQEAVLRQKYEEYLDNTRYDLSQMTYDKFVSSLPPPVNSDLDRLLAHDCVTCLAPKEFH